MLNMGGPELFMLGILALILFGPRRLPELGKALGQGLAAFRETSRQLRQDFTRQLEEETRDEAPAPPPRIDPEVLRPLGKPMGGTAPTEVAQAEVAEAPEWDADPASSEAPLGEAEVVPHSESSKP
jgi:sec-independent protein translocase protein TatA